MISSSRFIVNKTLSLSRRPILSSAATTTTFPVPIGRRGYRGDTGEEVQVLSESEEALLKIAVPRSQEIFRQHIEIPVDDLFTRQKRLIYRAKQRGWLGKFFFLWLKTVWCFLLLFIRIVVVIVVVFLILISLHSCLNCLFINTTTMM